MDRENIKEEVSKELKEAAKENMHVSIPVYEGFKGKRMHGSKTWKASDKENRTIKILAIVFAVMVILALVSFVLPIPTGFKILLFVLAILSGIGGVGGYLFYMVYCHHKEDPIEMQYYDVDYRQNHITGNGYDNTREISKEEFLGKKTEE